MTCLVSKGRTGVAMPWLEKVWIWSHKAVHVVSAHKLLSTRFFFEWYKLIRCDKAVVIVTCIATNNNHHTALHDQSYLSYNQHYHHSTSFQLCTNIILISIAERLVNWAMSRRVSSSPDEDNSLVLVDSHRARARPACPQWERGAVVSSWWEERELVEVSRGGF